MTQLLVLPGTAALSGFRLVKLREQLSLESGIYAEYVHLLELGQSLTADESLRVEALLRYGPVTELPQACGELVAIVVPRLGTISPWSSKATDIFHTCGLNQVVRVERGVRWYLESVESSAAIPQMFDRMTQRIVSEAELNTVFQSSQPRPLSTVPVMDHGLAALQEANAALGLALSAAEVDYLAHCYAQLQRDPTDIELMMFAQANSEHCRHKIFNADWIIDGIERKQSLFDMIRNTYRMINGEGILSAYAASGAP